MSATASAASAYINRQSVDRANEAFVWAAISYESDGQGRQVLRIKLHNDGSGTAFDVRWSVSIPGIDQHDELITDPAGVARSASAVIRAMRPGEVCPPADWFRQALDLPPDDVWWLIVRWTDAARVRWELAEQGPSDLHGEPQRLRTWRWQLWRPLRDW